MGKKMAERRMDRISQLPEPIIHHILSSLIVNTWDGHPLRQIVRMSVLSKTWFDLTSSFPYLTFSVNNFMSTTKSFYKYVDYATSRFCQQNVPALKFTLIIDSPEAAELETVNKCLELVSKNGVMELEIDISHISDLKYRLPNILFSVSMLKSLTIRGCELPSDDVFKLKSLIYLELEEVYIPDEAIKYLPTGCPLLQVLKIMCCFGFKRFCVFGHQHLREVWIRYIAKVERIDIEAPNLSNLLITNMYPPPRMNLTSCKKLTTVTYNEHSVPGLNDYTNFLSNFPFIENLVLATRNICNNLKLSSHSLRTLVLHSNCDLENIEFKTPNLVSFVYASSYNSYSSIVMDERGIRLVDSTHLRARMHCYPRGRIDTFWFQKLKRFLHKKDGLEVLNLYIHAEYSQTLSDFKKLKEIELPPYELDHVELEMDNLGESSAYYISFVDAVLWCFRPRTLTLRSFFSSTSSSTFEKVVKFTYEKLLQQEDKGHTKIQIVWPNSESQKHFDDSKSLSMDLVKEKQLAAVQ